MPAPRIGRSALDRKKQEAGVTLDLSPDEIARLEAEKAEILRSLRSGVRPEPVSTEEPAPAAAPSEPAATAWHPIPAAQLTEISAELAQAQAEIAEAERQWDERVKAMKAEYDARLAELRAKQHDAQRRADAARAAAEADELAQRAASVEAERRRAEAEAKADQERQRQATRERLQPLVDKAQARLAQLRDVEARYGSALEALTADAPVTWSASLRVRYEQRVAIPAGELRQTLSRTMRGLQNRIDDAGKILVKYTGTPDQRREVSQLIYELGLMTHGAARDFVELIADLTQEVRAIEEAARAWSGEPEVVVVAVPGAVRQEKARQLGAGIGAEEAEALKAAAALDQQTHATMGGDII